MKYKKFIIENYKAINTPIEIDFNKNNLIPIIGINECGKTTILNAIFAFDYSNDLYDSAIHHVTDVHNLYDTNVIPARVSAVIEINGKNIEEIINEYIGETNEKEEIPGKEKVILPKYKLPKQFKSLREIKITRVFTSTEDSKYIISPKEIFKRNSDENIFLEKLILKLPFILYFDDFRDSFPDKIEISDSTNNHWLEVIEELFQSTNESYSVHELPKAEKRHRNNIIADVKRKLNNTLTKEWANFKLDNKDALEIRIDFDTDETNKKHYLSFEVIEKNDEGKERNFYVRDRSKGFYWFFNFVMKLEFNPKFMDERKNTVYLLDEPGSYLHPFAQNKLCKKLLDLSKDSIVIYCTHTHYLLDPDIIPLNTIHIASKTDFGKIKFEKCNNYSQHSNNLQSAFQPIFDALYLKPFNLDFTFKKMLLVEGIYDYYSFSMFKKGFEFGIFPGKNADSLIGNVSIMLGFNIDFIVLLDNDNEGRDRLNKAELFFGKELTTKRFLLLSTSDGAEKKILQDLYDGSDLVLIRKELQLNNDVSFKKTIASLYYSDKRDEILSQVSKKTKESFHQVLTNVKFSSELV